MVRDEVRSSMEYHGRFRGFGSNWIDEFKVSLFENWEDIIQMSLS